MSKIEKVVLIEPRAGLHFFSFARMPLLGLPILGKILQKMKIQVKIFCEKLAPIDWQAVAEADLVGISVLTNLAPRAYEIAERVKQIAKATKRKILIVMGGPHPTFLPEEALEKGADFVVRHEGEETFKELIENLQGRGNKELKEIQGLSYKIEGEIRHNPDRTTFTDLDQIPPPDFSLIEGKERINFIPLQTSRGCPHNCEFCSVVKMFGRKIRYKNPEKVVEEIKRVISGKHIFIVDDNFSANPKRTLALLEAMKKAGIKRHWSTQERVSVAQKRDILKLMRETGCIRLYQGIESFNPEALEEWGKGQTPEEIEEAISVIHQYGLLIHGMFILGADADTPETIKQTVRSALRSKIDTIQPFVLVPPPGTRLYQKLNREDRIFDKDWSHYDGQFVVFKPKQMTPWQLQKLAIWAFEKIYTYWRSFKWALKGKGRNAFFTGYGRYAFKRWLKENQPFLREFKRRWT